jgi:hypothetical protein
VVSAKEAVVDLEDTLAPLVVPEHQVHLDSQVLEVKEDKEVNIFLEINKFETSNH